MSTNALTYTGTDRLIRLNDVPQIDWLPARRGGAKLNVSTVWRWAMRGCAGVKLATVSVGSTLCTSESDLRAFFEAVAIARRGGQPAPVVRTPRQQERAITAAGERLDAAKIG